MVSRKAKQAIGRTGLIKKVSPEINKDKKKTPVVKNQKKTKNIEKKEF